MKQSICLSILFFMGCILSFAGNPALLHQQSVPDPTAQTLDRDDWGDQKKKKKKKKKSGFTTFQQGAGASIFFAPNTAAEENNSAKNYGISYFPSFELKNLGNKSLRLALSPSLYTNFKFSSREGASGSAFLFDLPASLELHLGDPAKGNGFGGHVGAGFAYNRMVLDGFGGNKALGPHFTAGVRWNVVGHTCGLRTNFLLNVKKGKDEYGGDPKNVFSLSFAYFF